MTRVSRASNHDTNQGMSRIGSVKGAGQSWTPERLPPPDAGSRGMIDVCVGLRVELGCREYGGTATGLPMVPIDPSGLARGPFHEDGSRVVEVAPGVSRLVQGRPTVGLTLRGMGTCQEGVPARGRGRLTGSPQGLTNWNERNRRSIREWAHHPLRGERVAFRLTAPDATASASYAKNCLMIW